MENIEEQIKAIHPKFEIKNKVLHLIGNTRGYELEKIVALWNGPIYVDSAIGKYKHPSKIPIKIGRNVGIVTGDLSNANICCKTKKKIKRERKRLLSGKGWINIGRK